MLTIHHLSISQSDRVVWLCEELAIPYVLKRYQRDTETRLAPPEYKALTPFGTAPVITDGALVLGESGAILEYLAQTYGDGRLIIAPGQPGYADFLYWFHFANGSFMPAALIESIARRVEGGPALMAGLRARVDRAYDMAEARLAAVPYFAGAEFTIADIMMLFPMTTMRVFAKRDLTPYPNIRAYLQRSVERPAYQAAMRKADPDFNVPIE